MLLVGAYYSLRQAAEGLSRMLSDPSLGGHPKTGQRTAPSTKPSFSWLSHFGNGFVRTPDNFGLTGERPTHPELLDYLAKRLVKNGWSIKSMHRLLMLSNTYQCT